MGAIRFHNRTIEGVTKNAGYMNGLPGTKWIGSLQGI